MTDDVSDNGNLVAVFVDPDDDGFHNSRAKQWASLCPHMNPTEFRIYTVLLSLCSKRNSFRKLTLKEIAAIVPAGRVALGEVAKPVSVSTVASAINALSAIHQVTNEHGKAVRVSNKTKGELRLAPWRSLNHECDISRNVHDALARVRGIEGEDGPRYPLGLNPAQDSVPRISAAQDPVPTPDPAQDLVPAAQDLVPLAQEAVPTAQETVPSILETQGPTSGNTGPTETPSGSSFGSSSSTPTHTPRPRETVEDEPNPETVTGVCVVSSDDKDQIIAAIRANVIDRAPASKQKEPTEEPRLKELKLAIIELAVQCFAAGATVPEIDAALSGAINPRTTHPYTHGTGALQTLLDAKKRNANDPFGAAKRAAELNSWVDEDGFEWPHHDPYARECKGQSCGDWKGKRYVAMVEQFRQDGSPLGFRPVDGTGTPFSCPVCREAYKKENAPV